MTEQEKLALVISGIVSARKQDLDNPFLQLPINKNNRLNQIELNELKAILDNLESKEKILTVGGLNFPKSEKSSHYSAALLSDKIYFNLEILANFDNWYSAYLSRTKLKLEDLSKGNLDKMILVVAKINEKFELTHTPEFDLYIKPGFEDCLKFLHNKSVLLNYKRIGNLDHDNRFFLNINVDKFKKFLPQPFQVYNEKFGNPIKTVMETPLASTPPKSKDILYSITFSMNNEIVLNDLVVLKKPNLNSENTAVFEYLIKNSNKKISKKEIENHIGNSIGKDLHKIVENLGFTGDFRTAFFKVSKDALYFRNPITKADFEQLGILPLRISKK